MLRAPVLSDLAHGFTGRAEGDLRRTVHAGQAALVERLGGRGALRTVQQVHSARVLRAEALADPTGEGDVPEADGLVCTTPGMVIAVRVADCVPVLLAGPGGVAAVHAGWRGTAGDIVRVGARALAEACGCEVGALRAAVGPSIRGCCYEVGDEVIEGVGAVAPGRRWLTGRHVDLAAANAAILEALGIPAEVVGGCTRCGEGWYSHRRGDVERQVGAIRA